MQLPPCGASFRLIEWEAFLDAVGMARWTPVGSHGVSADVLVAAGARLGAQRFWNQLSPAALAYLGRRFSGRRLERQVARHLPCRGVRIQDMFLREVFHPLAGDTLQYLDLRGTARIVANRLIHTERSSHSIQMAVTLTTSTGAGTFAALYGATLPYPSVDIFVPGTGRVRRDVCVWDEDADIARGAGRHRLAPIYGQYGLEAWFLQAGVPRHFDVATCVHILQNLQHWPDAVIWPTASHVMQRLAAGMEAGRTSGHLGHWNHALPLAFQNGRLIVVRSTATIKFLSTIDAYWSVAPVLVGMPAEFWALERHYPATLKAFFLSIGVREEMQPLRVPPPMLDPRMMQPSVQGNPAAQPVPPLRTVPVVLQEGEAAAPAAPPTTVSKEQGLSMLDLAPAPVDYARRALAAAQHGDATQVPEVVFCLASGRPAPQWEPFMAAIAPTVHMLGIPFHAVGFALGARPGYSVNNALILPLGRGVDWASLVSELTRALAHTQAADGAVHSLSQQDLFAMVLRNLYGG